MCSSAHAVLQTNLVWWCLCADGVIACQGPGGGGGRLKSNTEALVKREARRSFLVKLKLGEYYTTRKVSLLGCRL